MHQNLCVDCIEIRYFAFSVPTQKVDFSLLNISSVRWIILLFSESSLHFLGYVNCISLCTGFSELNEIGVYASESGGYGCH